jgi:HPt (histidine-containing phosphotransfer) domain-containing protein
MHDAAARRDPATLRHEAHRLKSSSAFVGAIRLAQLCEALEQDAQANEPARWGAGAEAIGVEFVAALLRSRPRVAGR